jgi:hypothetical protein
MTKFFFHGIEVDLSRTTTAHGLDASRWRGRVLLTLPDGSIATANWRGAEGAADGLLVDVEGEDEAACARVDGLAEELSEEIARRLGDPCEPEERSELGRISDWFDEGGERARRVAA